MTSVRDRRDSMAEDVDLKALFENIDADGDGVLSHQDLVTSLPQEWDEDQIATIFRRLDINHKKFLTFDEFVNGVSFFLDPELVGSTRSSAKSVSFFEVKDDELAVEGTDGSDSDNMMDVQSEDDDADVGDDRDGSMGALTATTSTDITDEAAEVHGTMDHPRRHSIHAVGRGRDVSSVDDAPKLGSEDQAFDTIAVYREKVHRLKQKCLTLQQRVKMMSEAGISMETENYNLRQELEATSSSLRYARQEIREQKENVCAYQRMIKSMQSAELSLKMKMMALEKHKENVAEQLREKEQEHSSLLVEATQLREKMETQKSKEIQRRHSVVEQAKAEVFQSSQAQIDLLRSELDTANDEMRALLVTMDEQQLELAQLRDRLEAHENERRVSPIPPVPTPSGLVSSHSLAEDMRFDDDDDDDDDDEVVIVEADEEGIVDVAPDISVASRVHTKSVAWAPSTDMRSRAVTEFPLQSASPASSSSQMIRMKRAAAQQAHKLMEDIAQKRKDKQVELMTDMRDQELEDAKHVIINQKKRVFELETKCEQLQNELERYRAAEAEEAKRKEEKAEAELQATQNIRLSANAQLEVSAYTRYINHALEHRVSAYPQLLPLDDTSSAILMQIRDGWLLAEYLNTIVPNTVDVRALNSPDNISDADMHENLTLIIDACRSVGVRTQHITPSVVIKSHKKPLLIIEFIFQLVKTRLLLRMNARQCPELLRTVPNGRSDELVQLRPDERLKLWMNYHVKHAVKSTDVHSMLLRCNIRGILNCEQWQDVGTPKKIVGVLLLMHRVHPDVVTIARMEECVTKGNASEFVVECARELGVVDVFVTPGVLLQGGDEAHNLNMAFIGALFNVKHGLEALTVEERKETAELMLDVDDDDDEYVATSREERAFRMWINSMGCTGQYWSEPIYLSDLFADCRDGIALLRIIDHIRPGFINWKRVERTPKTNKFKMVSNCNTVVECCRKMHLSVHNIGGTDIVDRNRKLVLALVWQLMHHHVSKFLRNLYRERRRQSVTSATDAPQSNDELIMSWANKSVKTLSERHHALIIEQNLTEGPFTYAYGELKSFHDRALSNCLFFLHLLWAKAPHAVDWRQVTHGNGKQEKLLNARYAVSIARKLGAIIFLVPEDLVSGNVKMIITFVASILQIEGANKS